MKKHTGGSSFRDESGLSHYERNKKYYKDKAKEQGRIGKEFIDNIRRNGSCKDCGISGKEYPCILDFDHVNGKTATIGGPNVKHWSIERIKDELSRCELVCSNCHRIRTTKRRNGLIA